MEVEVTTEETTSGMKAGEEEIGNEEEEGSLEGKTGKTGIEKAKKARIGGQTGEAEETTEEEEDTPRETASSTRPISSKRVAPTKKKRKSILIPRKLDFSIEK